MQYAILCIGFKHINIFAATTLLLQNIIDCYHVNLERARQPELIPDFDGFVSDVIDAPDGWTGYIGDFPGFQFFVQEMDTSKKFKTVEEQLEYAKSLFKNADYLQDRIVRGTLSIPHHVLVIDLSDSFLQDFYNGGADEFVQKIELQVDMGHLTKDQIEEMKNSKSCIKMTTDELNRVQAGELPDAIKQAAATNGSVIVTNEDEVEVDQTLMDDIDQTHKNSFKEDESKVTYH